VTDHTFICLRREEEKRSYYQTCLAALAHDTTHDAHERTCKAMDAFALEFICYGLGFPPPYLFRRR
jgi:hypothetical protein